MPNHGSKIYTACWKCQLDPGKTFFVKEITGPFFALYNQLPKDIWLTLIKGKSHHFVWRKYQLPCWNLPVDKHLLHLTNQHIFSIIFELHTSFRLNAKMISLANSSCIRVIWSMSCCFYTWALTDGVWSLGESTEWVLRVQNWGSMV